jgi:hypothetical protein
MPDEQPDAPAPSNLADGPPLDPKAAERRLADVRASNRTRMAPLLAAGALGPLELLDLRLAVLLDLILTPEDRIVVDLDYEYRLAGKLEAREHQFAEAVTKAEAEARKQALVTGINGTPRRHR